MVMTTTAAKYVAPGAGTIVERPPMFTRATITAMTKISSMDQRPMNLISLNINVLCLSQVFHCLWIEIKMRAIPTILKAGTRILAKKMITAMK